MVLQGVGSVVIAGWTAKPILAPAVSDGYLSHQHFRGRPSRPRIRISSSPGNRFLWTLIAVGSVAWTVDLLAAVAIDHAAR
jgi:hypothetical protein